MYREDTIAAIATPPGVGSVGVVRISGPDSERIAADVFRRRGGKNGGLHSHRLYFGTVREPANGALLDEALISLMRKPRSYTGEDVVEFYCHGGPLVVRRILEVVLSRGARMAEPGEFTRRAFLNGRMDLAQAEAVMDLVHARTERALELAAGQVHGGLSQWVRELRESLLDIVVQIEAAVDFPEEEIELLRRDQLGARLTSLRDRIVDLAATYRWGRLFREGARVCIVGRPNVGKSSLLNALIGEERVIVTPVPGTTRDVIEESINLDGLPLVLWDTAGIHEARDQVEEIGVSLALQRAAQADAVLVVLDGSVPFSDEDAVVARIGTGKKGIAVINKSDLQPRLQPEEVESLLGRKVCAVSAKEGTGIRELKAMLRELLLGVEADTGVVITNVRHKASLERAAAALGSAAESLGSGMPPEIIAVSLDETREALEEIVGIINNEDILERIFSKFCIGK
jgi:tRNA modification GTPase